MLLPQPKILDKSLKFEHVSKTPFGEEFTDFYHEIKEKYPVTGFRDAEYMTWRYIDNPLYQADTLKCYRDGKLRGYAVFGAIGAIGHIADIMATDELILESMMARLFKIARKHRVCTVSIKLQDSNTLIPTFVKKFGFRERDDATSSVMSYAPEGSELAKTVLNPDNWYMTVGDRDV